MDSWARDEFREAACFSGRGEPAAAVAGLLWVGTWAWPETESGYDPRPKCGSHGGAEACPCKHSFRLVRYTEKPVEESELFRGSLGFDAPGVRTGRRRGRLQRETRQEKEEYQERPERPGLFSISPPD